jgi:peptide deformylase
MRLPDYVVFDVQNPSPLTVTSPSAALTFPLSPEDLIDVATVEAKFDSEENMAGLAAPQIGIPKQIIVFRAEDLTLRKWRPDFTQTMPRAVWINPTYEGIPEEGQHRDYEGCFSVKDVAAPVPRFKKIHYQAYAPDGTRVHGTAEGFLARIIQHEIDHVNGILFVERANPEEVLPLAEYRARRAAALAEEDA